MDNGNKREEAIIGGLFYFGALIFLLVAPSMESYPVGWSMLIYFIASVVFSFSLDHELLFSSFGLEINIGFIIVSVWLMIMGDTSGNTTFMFLLGLTMSIFCIYRTSCNIKKIKIRETDINEYNKIRENEEKTIMAILDAASPNYVNVSIEQERLDAEASQKADAPWGKKYFTYPCPHCGHYKVRYATWDDKKMSVAFWGAWSSKVGKNYKCDYCKRVFNE